MESILVKACYDYQAKSDQELSFSAGDIIVNVIKQDHGWWKGDLGNRTGCYFPSNFVKEIEEQDLMGFDSVLIFSLLTNYFSNWIEYPRNCHSIWNTKR